MRESAPVAAAFENDVRTAAGSIRSSLARILAAVDADATQPRAMARLFGLDKTLAWKLSRVRGGIVVFPLLVAALGWPIMIFQVFRHQLVVLLLSVPIITVGFGYDYISNGEIPPGVSDDDVKNA